MLLDLIKMGIAVAGSVDHCATAALQRGFDCGGGKMANALVNLFGSCKRHPGRCARSNRQPLRERGRVDKINQWLRQRQHRPLSVVVIPARQDEAVPEGEVSERARDGPAIVELNRQLLVRQSGQELPQTFAAGRAMCDVCVHANQSKPRPDFASSFDQQGSAPTTASRASPCGGTGAR